MSGVHTIFDTRRLNVSDDEKAYSASDTKLKVGQLAQYYALSFQAERGELTTVQHD